MGTINAIQVALPHLSEGASIIATGIGRRADGRPQQAQPGADPGGMRLHASPSGLISRVRARTRHRAGACAASAPTSSTPPTATPTCCRASRCTSSFRPDLENPTRADAEPVFGVQQAMKVNFIEPEDISNAVLWLASEESRFVTGMQLRVDAGGYLKWYDYHV